MAESKAKADPAATRRVLVVEDEEIQATLLAEALRTEGFAVDVLLRGAEAVDYVRRERPSAVLLDLVLPDTDGFEVCREIRAFSTVPLIMITGRVEEIDRLLGLELGADDYVCKPYQPREVVARVRALLRRSIDWRDAVSDSRLSLDESTFQARWEGKRLDLTAVEFRLLKALGERPGRVLSRSQLLDAIYADFRVVSDRTVDSHIKNLRRKIGEACPGADPVESVYGVGYRLLLQE